jgi:hypothetical protein
MYLINRQLDFVDSTQTRLINCKELSWEILYILEHDFASTCVC